jgi:hypothetical protein
MAVALDLDVSLKHLSRVRAELFDYRDMWYDIGTEFGLPSDKLDNIKQQASNEDARECLLRMLIEWLRAQELKPSWRKVSQAVQKHSLKKILAIEKSENQTIPSPNGDQSDNSKQVHVRARGAPIEPLEEIDGVHTAHGDHIDSVADDLLSADDLAKVRMELVEVQTKWYDIGLDLGLPVNTLETIKQECQDTPECLRKMLLEWLKMIDLQPSWKTLIDVLQNKVINEGALAVTIAKKYGIIQTSPSPTLEHTPPPFQSAAQTLQINWKVGPNAPTALDLDSCAVKGNSVYYYCNTSNDIFKFNTEREEWITVTPMCPQKSLTLVVIEGMLCAVGGEDVQEQQNTDQEKRSPIRGLMSKGQFKHWAEYFPQLTTPRSHVAAVYTQGVLIIAGGVTQSPQGESTIYTQLVEILDVHKKQWYTTCNLPYSIRRPSIITCGSDIFISGAYDNKVYTTSLTSLLLNASRCAENAQATDTDQESIWKPTTACPTSNVYLAELDGKPIAIGGLESEKSYSKEIYMYDKDQEVWNSIGEVSQPQRFSQVAMLAEDKIVLAVGWTTDAFVDTIEIGTIDRSQEYES